MRRPSESHSRRNLLTGDWVLVSPNRTQRPWQGQIDRVEVEELPGYDKTCYLCPGNVRAGGHRNPKFAGPFVFDNDFSALSRKSDFSEGDQALFQSRSESGICRVLCYTEAHNQRLATMSVDEIATGLLAMFAEIDDLSADPNTAYVQAFENRGKMMGCSNAHPHAQLWAIEHLPNEIQREAIQQDAYFKAHQRALLQDYLAAELESGERLVCQTSAFAAVVPYWASWPYEVLISPRRHLAEPQAMTDAERDDLAHCLQQVLSAYERKFAAPVPYSMGLHPQPCDGKPYPGWQFHIHIYPPLLRSATVRK
ncbi:MAG: galactose-1-phosphate uridylyltransferase, partial [Pseudomonadota bacterium]